MINFGRFDEILRGSKKGLNEAGAILGPDGRWGDSWDADFKKPDFRSGGVSAFSQEEIEDSLPRVKGTGERVRLSDPDHRQDEQEISNLVRSLYPELSDGIKKLVVELTSKDKSHGRYHIEEAVKKILLRLSSTYEYY